LRVGATGRLAPEWSARVQLQDSRELGSDRSSVPFISGSEGDDPLDVRQAYLEYKSPTLVCRVGRQLLALGEERLVGSSEWSNIGRSFDAARVTWPKIGGGLDVFVSSVVHTQPDGRTGWHANHSSSQDLFGGVYARFAATRTLHLEPYLLGRDSRKDLVYSAGPAGSSRPFDIPQKILTGGVRVVGGPADRLGGFDYDFDFVGQTGETRGRQLVAGTFAYPGPAWLEHRAWAMHAGAGYAFAAGGQPLRLYAEVNRASGDRDPTDRQDDAFFNLFPRNHKFYGIIDAFGWKNMRELALTAATSVHGIKARLEQHWFALENVNDTWFRSNTVSTVRPLTAAARQAPRRAGDETALVFSGALGAHATLEVGGSYFAVGPYLQAIGGGSDARFGYAQLTLVW